MCIYKVGFCVGFMKKDKNLNSLKAAHITARHSLYMILLDAYRSDVLIK